MRITTSNKSAINTSADFSGHTVSALYKLFDEIKEGINKDVETACIVLTELENRNQDIAFIVAFAPVFRHHRAVAERKLSVKIAMAWPHSTSQVERLIAHMINLPIEKQISLFEGEEVDWFYRKQDGSDGVRKVSFLILSVHDQMQVLSAKGIRSPIDQKAYLAAKKPRVYSTPDPARGIDPNKKPTLRADTPNNRLQIGDVFVSVDELMPLLGQFPKDEILRMNSLLMNAAFANT